MKTKEETHNELKICCFCLGDLKGNKYVCPDCWGPKKHIEEKVKERKECPNCHKIYMTVLDRQHPELCIQEEFPNAKAWEREQHLTGICSDKCGDEYLGVSRR